MDIVYKKADELTLKIVITETKETLITLKELIQQKINILQQIQNLDSGYKSNRAIFVKQLDDIEQKIIEAEKLGIVEVAV